MAIVSSGIEQRVDQNDTRVRNDRASRFLSIEPAGKDVDIV